MLQQQQQQAQQAPSSSSSGDSSSNNNTSSYNRPPPTTSSASHSSALAMSWHRGQKWSFSTRLLVAITALWLGAAALMVLVPETQALLTYLHWVRWPPFRDLADLRSFRLEVRA